jgi:hypothetical protein
MAEIFDIGGLGEHMRRLSPEQKALRLAAFYSILEGKAASSNDLALQCRLTRSQAQQCIKEMADQGILVINEQGAVVGSHGLSIIPTEHRISIGGQDLFTWCAVDAVGIPAVLGVDATIISKCFQCDEPIEITMSSGEVQYSNHADTRIWVIEADLGRSIVGCA